MKRNLFLVRTVGDADRLSLITKNLKKCTKADFVIIQECFDNESFKEDIIEPDYIKLSSEFIRKNNLTKLKKTGWQCGDYVAYAGFNYYPNYDYYWVVDDDVVFNCNLDQFIDDTNKFNDDCLALNFGLTDKNSWSWYSTLENIYPNKVYGMLYSLVRLSNSALEFLKGQRSNYHPILTNEFHENFANDETFTATYLVNNGYRCSNLRELLPTYFGPYFSFSNPIIAEELSAPYLQGRILHPVCNIERAYQKTLKRIQNDQLGSLEPRLLEIYEYCGEDVFTKYFNILPSDVFKNLINLESLYISFKGLDLPFIHKIWFYKPQCLVLEFNIGNFYFAIDLMSNREIFLISRNENAAQFTMNYFNFSGKIKVFSNHHLTIGDFEKYFESDTVDVVKNLILKVVEGIWEYKIKD